MLRVPPPPPQKHSGAKHKGAFSRLKYMHNYNGRGNSFRVSFDSVLQFNSTMAQHK